MIPIEWYLSLHVGAILAKLILIGEMPSLQVWLGLFYRLYEQLKQSQVSKKKSLNPFLKVFA